MDKKTRDHLYSIRWGSNSILESDLSEEIEKKAEYIYDEATDALGLERRRNRDGEVVEEIPDENDKRPVIPNFPAAKKHFFPLNTRVELDPDRRGYIKPKGIVWHYTVSYHTQATVDYFKRNVVDVHFVVGHKGETIQMVEGNRSAAHAGRSSWKGISGLNDDFIGIEFVNMGPLYPIGGGKFVDYYNRDRRRKGKKYNIWMGAIHENKFQGHKYWEPLTEAQFRKGLEITYWAMKEYGFTKDYVTAHHEVSPGRKIDVGGTMPVGKPMDWVRNEMGLWVSAT